MLDKAAEALLAKEALSGEELRTLFSARRPRRILTYFVQSKGPLPGHDRARSDQSAISVGKGP